MTAPSLDDPATPPTAVAQLAAAENARRTGVERHEIALTLGSGWGRAAERLGEIVARIPAEEVPGFTASGIPGHSGVLTSMVSATVENDSVARPRSSLTSPLQKRMKLSAVLGVIPQYTSSWMSPRIIPVEIVEGQA